MSAQLFVASIKPNAEALRVGQRHLEELERDQDGTDYSDEQTEPT
jgi:hypothetical protein